MSGERLLTRPFVHLWLFALITFLSAFQLLPSIPLRILDLGGTKAEAGWFLAAYTYASAFAAPLMGSVADHFGRKRLLVTASAVFILFSVLYGLVTNLPLLLLIGAVHGAIWSGILSASAAVMTEFIPPSRRTEGIAYWGMASTAAIAIAPTIGLSVYRLGWTVLAAELAMISIVMLLISRRIPIAANRSADAFPPVRDLFDIRVLTVALSLFTMSFGYGGVTSYVALLSAARKIPYPSLFFNVFAVTILIMRVFAARLGDRFGPKALLLPSLAIVPFSLALLAAAHSVAVLALSAFLFGLGFGGSYPALVAWVLERSDPRRRGGTFGSILWAFDAGIGTGSLIIGLLVQSRGYGTAFLAAAGLSALGIPIFLLASPLLRRSGPVDGENHG